MSMIVTCLEPLGAAATEKPSAKLYKFNTRARFRVACDELSLGGCAALDLGCADGARRVVDGFGVRNRLSVSHGVQRQILLLDVVMLCRHRGSDL